MGCAAQPGPIMEGIDADVSFTYEAAPGMHAAIGRRNASTWWLLKRSGR
jgi:hypothetical protein